MLLKHKMTNHFDTLVHSHCIMNKIGTLWLCSTAQFKVHIGDRIGLKLCVEKKMAKVIKACAAHMFSQVGKGYVYQNGMIQAEKKAEPVLPEAQKTHSDKSFPGK